MPQLKQIKEELDAKRDSLREIFEKGRTSEGVLDFQSIEKIDGLDLSDLEGTAKSVRIAEHVQTLTEELNDLAEQAETLEAAEKSREEFERNEKRRKRPEMPSGEKGDPPSLGKRITSHPRFEQWKSGHDWGRNGAIELPDVGLKTLFQTSDGWLPESTRTGRITEAVTRPVQVLDIIPRAQTGQPSVLWMLETTRTHAAAETDEGAQKPEAEFDLTEQSTTVQEIATSIPVTETQLEDVPAVESYLEARLQFGIRQRLDQQVISGDGVSPNLEGILNNGSIQTLANAGEPTPDTIYMAMTNIRVTGRAMPTHVLLHPNDWQSIRLLRTSDDVYIWGSPSDVGIERIWGLPVVQCESLTENTGLVGSFEMAWITLYERRGIVVEQGFVNDQFRQNRRTIRASGRWALAIPRPAAFSTVTGI